jgi:hypothetical protein
MPGLGFAQADPRERVIGEHAVGNKPVARAISAFSVVIAPATAAERRASAPERSTPLRSRCIAARLRPRLTLEVHHPDHPTAMIKLLNLTYTTVTLRRRASPILVRQHLAQHDRVVVMLVSRRIDEREPTLARHRAELAQQVLMGRQFGTVAPAELLPTGRVMAEPAA